MRRWLTLVILLGLTGRARAEVILDGAAHTLALGRHVALYRDPTNRRTFEELERCPDCFVPSTRARPQFPVSSHLESVWVRLTVTDRSDWRWILRVGHPRPEVLDLYLRDAAGNVARARAGFMVERSELTNPDRLIRLDLPLPKNQPATLYLRAQSRKFGAVFELVEASTYLRDHLWEDIRDGSYLGLALCLGLYNLFLFLALRDRSYLYYVLFVWAFAYYQLDATGLLADYGPGLARRGTFFSGGPLALAELAALAFIRAFLRTPVTQPRMDKLLLLGLTAGTVTAVSGFLGWHAISTPGGVIGGFFASLLIPLVTIRAVRQGYRPAWYFLVSVSALAVAGLWTTAAWLGWLPLGFVTDHGVMLGSEFDMVMLSLGLADRLRVLQREREESRRRASEAEERALRAEVDRLHQLEAFRSEQLERLIAAQENERGRIARRVRAEIVRRLQQIRGLLGDDTDPASAAALAARSEEEALALSSRLLPRELGDGLQAAIARSAQALSSEAAIEVDIAPAAEALLGDRKLAVFRIVQEALSNACRHARARHIRVRLDGDPAGARLCIADDGAGFTWPPVAETPSLGLRLMEERARLLGGQLVVRSAPGAGAELTVTLPA